MVYVSDIDKDGYQELTVSKNIVLMYFVTYP